MQLLQELGRAYQALAQYDCQGALDLFTALPPHHYNTGWVLGQVGRAHFELTQYQEVGTPGGFFFRRLELWYLIV